MFIAMRVTNDRQQSFRPRDQGILCRAGKVRDGLPPRDGLLAGDVLQAFSAAIDFGTSKLFLRVTGGTAPTVSVHIGAATHLEK